MTEHWTELTDEWTPMPDGPAGEAMVQAKVAEKRDNPETGRAEWRRVRK